MGRLLGEQNEAEVGHKGRAQPTKRTLPPEGHSPEQYMRDHVVNSRWCVLCTRCFLLTGAMSRKWPSSGLGETSQEAKFWGKLMQSKRSSIYIDLKEKELFRVNDLWNFLKCLLDALVLRALLLMNPYEFTGFFQPHRWATEPQKVWATCSKKHCGPVTQLSSCLTMAKILAEIIEAQPCPHTPIRALSSSFISINEMSSFNLPSRISSLRPTMRRLVLSFYRL